MRVREFVPAAQALLAEKTDTAAAFVQERLKAVWDVILYRGLVMGNVPRYCHSRGNWFLLTAEYNAYHCNNVAPVETERTCREVGAHRREAQGKANRTPAQVQYDRAYNQLKLRKKASIDEWNAAA